uniref:Secreted protein n=1 Tax=Triticum urartu TaxID=4572 RepID=A0A8R7THJ8_TRIUA
MGRGWGIWRRTELLLWLVQSQMVDVDHAVPWREGNLEEQLSRKDIDHPLSATAGPRWFMDPRSRCTDCSLKPMTE